MRPVLVAIVVCAATLVLAMPASSMVSCGTVEVHGEPFNVTSSGRVACGEARATIKAFLSGAGTEHGGASSPSYEKTWTLHGGWRCGYATGGGGCSRRRPSATILGQRAGRY